MSVSLSSTSEVPKRQPMNVFEIRGEKLEESYKTSQTVYNLVFTNATILSIV